MKKAFDAEYSTGQVEFQGKLISLGDQIQEFNNANKTRYVVGAIEFVNTDGELRTVSAICYEKNISKVSVGTSYVCQAKFNEGYENPLIIITPFLNASRATSADFGTDFYSLQDEANVGAEQTA